MGKIQDFWSGNRTARTRTIFRTKYGKSVLLGISAGGVSSDDSFFFFFFLFGGGGGWQNLCNLAIFACTSAN